MPCVTRRMGRHLPGRGLAVYDLATLLMTLAMIALTTAAILATLYVVVPLAYRARMRRRHAAE